MKMKIDKKSKIYLIVIAVVAIILITGSIFVATNRKQVIEMQKADITFVNPGDLKELQNDYYGILVLGSDHGATRTNGGNHTDSVTYLAVNKKTKKIYALPIYRDVIIDVICTGEQKNINHVYRDNGADCLKQSVENLLGIQVDYQVFIMSDSFVNLFNTIGPLTITPEASYCSKFGNDDQEHCFTQGVTQEMTGNQLLAYTRFRGNTSGEMRANRHVQVLNAAYALCQNNKVQCGAAVLSELQSNKLQTDLPFEEVLDLQLPLEIENIGVVKGSNFEDANGWHQRMDETDKNEKVRKIQEEIFVN